MRKCCCCIPILGGATVLGFIALIFCALEFVVTIPYLAGIDTATFNPLGANIEYLYKQIEFGIKTATNDTELRNSIMIEVRDWTWTAILSEAISTGVYFTISLMMICGIQCDMRGLMIPYMVIQMLYIILAIHRNRCHRHVLLLQSYHGHCSCSCRIDTHVLVHLLLGRCSKGLHRIGKPRLYVQSCSHQADI